MRWIFWNQAAFRLRLLGRRREAHLVAHQIAARLRTRKMNKGDLRCTYRQLEARDRLLGPGSLRHFVSRGPVHRLFGLVIRLDARRASDRSPEDERDARNGFGETDLDRN